MSRKDAEAQSENEYAGVPLERDTDLGYKLCASAPLRDKNIWTIRCLNFYITQGLRQIALPRGYALLRVLSCNAQEKEHRQ